MWIKIETELKREIECHNQYKTETEPNRSVSVLYYSLSLSALSALAPLGSAGLSFFL
jgi:hypothetical protein